MIDLSTLFGLFDDEALVVKFLSLFQKEVPLLLVQLENNILEKEPEKANINAHTIKSQLKYLGATQAINLAESLEHACEPDAGYSVEKQLETLEALKKEITLVLLCTQNWLNGVKNVKP